MRFALPHNEEKLRQNNNEYLLRRELQYVYGLREIHYHLHQQQLTEISDFIFPLWPQSRFPCSIFRTSLFRFNCSLNKYQRPHSLLLHVACCPLFIHVSPVHNVRLVLSLLTVIRGVLNSYLVNRL